MEHKQGKPFLARVLRVRELYWQTSLVNDLKDVPSLAGLEGLQRRRGHSSGHT